MNVFGVEICTRAQSREGFKKLIVNCRKDFILREGRRDLAKGYEFVICVSAQMAQGEVSRGKNMLTDAVERTGAG